MVNTPKKNKTNSKSGKIKYDSVLKDDKIVILLGKSAAGKDTVARMLEKMYGYRFVISTTTRPMRDGESEGEPYFFVQNKEFEELIQNNSLIEYRAYDTLVNKKPERWYYGVEKHQVNSNRKHIVVLDTVGLREFKEYFKNRVVSFFIDVPDKVREDRCVSRGDFDKTEWHRRLEDDNIRFSKGIILSEIDYSVDGDRPTVHIVSEILDILKKNKLC